MAPQSDSIILNNARPDGPNDTFILCAAAFGVLVALAISAWVGGALAAVAVTALFFVEYRGTVRVGHEDGDLILAHKRNFSRPSVQRLGYSTVAWIDGRAHGVNGVVLVGVWSTPPNVTPVVVCYTRTRAEADSVATRLIASMPEEWRTRQLSSEEAKARVDTPG